ncbi:MAG: MMPL family transporter [Actinomycetota bacterium]
MLERLAHVCYRRRWRVLIAWVVVLVGISVLGNTVGGELETSFTLPESEARDAFDLLERKFPSQAGDGARLVMRADRPLTDKAIRKPLEELFTDLRSFEHVGGVQTPFALGAGGAITLDGTTGFAPIQFELAGPELPQEEIIAMRELVRSTEIDGVELVLGGEVVRFAEQQGPPNELLGVVAAIVILLITFGSVIAMGLPIMTAIFGLGIGTGFLTLFALFLEIPEFAPALAAMIGLGVGIDYALFIVTRYRQSLHAGMDPESAVVLSIMTAGRAVIFAGITVVISLLGLFLIGLSFVRGLAIAASMTVLIMMIASITLLPAVLGFAGKAIDRLHVPFLHRDESEHRASFWFRWSRFIQRRPWPAGIAGTLLLVVMAIPLFSINLGFSDASNDPEGSDTRRAYDILADGFGPGFNGPLLLAADLADPSERSELTKLTGAIGRTEGVALSLPARLNEARDAAVLLVVPETGPQAQATKELVKRLREDVIPATLSDDGPTVFVGGITAAFGDMSNYLQRRLGWFISAVVILSFLLLMVVFRSLLIPLKAAIVNLLGIGAAYGVIVAIFQWGWLSGLVGVDRTGPIEAFLPMMLFAILFGLSMDYEVFLMSRIREEYLRTKRNDIAVADGLAATARVITAAAAIMVTLFLSFVLGDERVIKLFGLGLAVAILLDATVIRMVVVPSFMELAGHWNWWLPKWLERLLPRVSVDSHIDPELLHAIDEGHADVVHTDVPPAERTVPKPKAPARAKAAPKPKPRAKGKPKPRPRAKPKPKARAKPKAKPKARPANRATSRRTRPT